MSKKGSDLDWVLASLTVLALLTILAVLTFVF